ncbi:hypothetical protein KQX54_006393 [Cotesia glomerata]|uniref:Uncharacterized protein n=1 Tax=Cotesia glomerata TaxID=32391 RepID=A0AAV7HWK1_COTGL|nr:hypothetical protein KQX54_006393 [Cotesia glomerata]
MYRSVLRLASIQKQTREKTHKYKRFYTAKGHPVGPDEHSYYCTKLGGSCLAAYMGQTTIRHAFIRTRGVLFELRAHDRPLIDWGRMGLRLEQLMPHKRQLKSAGSEESRGSISYKFYL